jgi:OOP family OmpA-OmpF porin
MLRPAVNVFESYDLNPKWESGAYVQKVDNFIVLLDSSQSMDEGYGGFSKLSLARDFTSAMNRTIPDLKLQGGLRTFGTGSCLGGAKSAMVYGMTAYTEAGFAEGLDQVACAGGNTPIANALQTAGEDLKPTEGKIAAIIVSDGKRRNMDPEPVAAARQLKEAYGERLCIYTVLIGDDDEGKALLQQMADEGQCGFAIEAQNIRSGEDMADFVERVFLAEAPPKPAPAPAPAPAPEPEKTFWRLDNTFFDTDKSQIKPGYYTILNEAVAVLRDKPKARLRIEGHCDIRGSYDYNMKLSQRRADAVKAYLVSKGIAAERLRAVGYGFTRPAAPNDSPENMAKNRRVELSLVE